MKTKITTLTLILALLLLSGFAPLATTTLTLNPQLITVPANTTEHDINFNSLLLPDAINGYARIQWVSGTTIQFNSNGQTITSASGAINSTQGKLDLPVKRGVNLRYKGGAGSETFIITIISK